MAHADYNCCAICDSKMDYNADDARTKEDLCSDCAFAVARAIPALAGPSVATLMNWMRTAEPNEVISTLDSLGFRTCTYRGEIDVLYREIKERPTPTEHPNG